MNNKLKTFLLRGRILQSCIFKDLTRLCIEINYSFIDLLLCTRPSFGLGSSWRAWGPLRPPVPHSALFQSRSRIRQQDLKKSTSQCTLKPNRSDFASLYMISWWVNYVGKICPSNHRIWNYLSRLWWQSWKGEFELDLKGCIGALFGGGEDPTHSS